jgi:hypothetical protein
MELVRCIGLPNSAASFEAEMIPVSSTYRRKPGYAMRNLWEDVNTRKLDR